MLVEHALLLVARGHSRDLVLGLRPAPVAQAAVNGRIATLLVDADRRVAGRIDGASGQIEYGDLAHPEIDDLLDDLGELVVKKGGEIVIVPAERMPTRTGIAAIYRF
jgi:hypothetical protein